MKESNSTFEGDEQGKKRSWWSVHWTLVLFGVVSIIAFVVFAIVGYGYFAMTQGPLPTERGDLGTLGDYFGGSLNAIFGFFSLILLLITIIMQSKELRNSTDELKNVSGALKRQNFEGTFFQLLQLHQNLVNDLTLNNAQEITRGRYCFPLFYHALKQAYYEEIKEIENQIQERKINNLLFSDLSSILSDNKEMIRRSYHRFYGTTMQEKLGHYFRNLYHMIRFVEIHQTHLDWEARKDYIHIIRAQFSSYEMILLFYNSLYFLYQYQEEEFYQTLENHLLLKGMLKDHLLPNEVWKKKEHFALYPKNAQTFSWNEEIPK